MISIRPERSFSKMVTRASIACPSPSMMIDHRQVMLAYHREIEMKELRRRYHRQCPILTNGSTNLESLQVQDFYHQMVFDPNRCLTIKKAMIKLIGLLRGFDPVKGC